jgi:hypothetical protein
MERVVWRRTGPGTSGASRIHVPRGRRKPALQAERTQLVQASAVRIDDPPMPKVDGLMFPTLWARLWARLDGTNHMPKSARLSRAKPKA